MPKRAIAIAARSRTRCVGGWRTLALVGLLAAGAPASLSADEIALRFSGVVDLTVFGGPSSAAYSGVVTWDPSTDPNVSGADWSRYLLDGTPGAVAAELAIDGVDYSGRVQPFSRFEQTFGDLFLELYFGVPIDFDGGALPDVARFALDMWTESPPAFDDISHLPADRSFVGDLERRRVWFTAAPGNDAQVLSDDVTIPEPASLTLAAAALLGSALRRHRRRSLRQPQR